MEASEGREIIVANDAGCRRDLLDPDAWHGPARPSCSCGRALLSNLSGGEVDGESEINRGDVSPLQPEVDGMVVHLSLAFFPPDSSFLE